MGLVSNCLLLGVPCLDQILAFVRGEKGPERGFDSI